MDATCSTASSATLLLRFTECSTFDIASFRHFAMSRRPTTAPSSSITGTWRKWFSTIVVIASIAESDIDTQVGFGVITWLIGVVLIVRLFATTRRVISVSVMIPTRHPEWSTISEASPRLFASICVTVRTVSLTLDNSAFFGRSWDTGRSFFVSFV